MKFQDYVKFSDTTAVYPNPDTDLAYPFLGLVDEFQEYLEATDRDDVLKELGDVLYYIARLDRALKLKLSINSALLGQFNEERSTKELGYLLTVDSSNFDVDFSKFLVSKKIGYLAGRCKKYLRLDYTLEKLQPLAFFSLMYILNQLRLTAKHHDSSLEEIMQINVDKLSSRKERGVLKGNGDNR